MYTLIFKYQEEKEKRVHWMWKKNMSNVRPAASWCVCESLYQLLYVGLSWMCGRTASRSTFPSHTGSPASSIHSISAGPPSTEMQMSSAHLPPLPGLSVIFCPRQDIAHLPSSVGMGVHRRSHHLPHVRSTASIKDEFLCQFFLHPIMSQLFHLRSLNKSRVNDTRTHVGSNEMTTTTNLRLCLLRALPSSFHPKALIIDYNKQIILKRLHV